MRYARSVLREAILSVMAAATPPGHESQRLAGQRLIFTARKTHPHARDGGLPFV
jgi:hypothetical protein